MAVNITKSNFYLVSLFCLVGCLEESKKPTAGAPAPEATATKGADVKPAPIQNTNPLPPAKNDTATPIVGGEGTVIACKNPLPADSTCIDILTKEMVDACIEKTTTAERPSGALACKTTTWSTKMHAYIVNVVLKSDAGKTPFAKSK